MIMDKIIILSCSISQNQAGPELTVILPSQPPQCWHYRHGATMPGTDHSYSLQKMGQKSLLTEECSKHKQKTDSEVLGWVSEICSWERKLSR